MEEFTLNWRFLLFFTSVVVLFALRNYQVKVKVTGLLPSILWMCGYWTAILFLLSMLFTAATGGTEWLAAFRG